MPLKTSPAQRRAIKRYQHRHKTMQNIYRWRWAYKSLLKVASVKEIYAIISQARKALSKKLSKKDK